MINLAAIAKLLITQLLGGTGLLDQIIQMGKSGSGPSAIMDFLEQHKPEVKNHEMWNNLRGKSEQEIESYAKNLTNSLGLNKM